MARITIREENREITNPDEICSYLEPLGIWYEKWPVEGRIEPDASDEEILTAYAPEVEQLKARGGFVTADVINVNPETPNLDAMLDKFAKEHTHSEDEVRFTISGRGVFHIHPENGAVIGIEVTTGDLINVPHGTRHWFNLCEERAIRCIRLFEDPSGWTPHYIDGGVHDNFAPLCMGRDYLPPHDAPDPVVKL